MDSCSLLVLSPSLLTLSYQFLAIKSDEALIQNLCHKTPEPVLCADCLHGDPSGKAADARRVALITVRCAECDAEQVYNFTFNLWQNTPKLNAALYNILDTCSSQFLVAHDSFRGATVALEDQGRRNWRPWDCHLWINYSSHSLPEPLPGPLQKATAASIAKHYLGRD